MKKKYFMYNMVIYSINISIYNICGVFLPLRYIGFYTTIEGRDKLIIRTKENIFDSIIAMYALTLDLDQFCYI